MELPRPTWRVFLAGVLAGAVDSAPSISGATVYYVVGIYRNLLESITRAWDAFFAAIRQRSFSPLINEPALRYLLVLKAGVVFSFLSFAHTILVCLQDERTRPLLFSIFFGFVLGSAFLCLRQVLSWNIRRTSLFVLGLTLGLCLVYNPTLFPESLYSVPVTVNLTPAANVDVEHARLLHVPFSALESIARQGVLDTSNSIIDEHTSLPISLESKGFVSLLPFQPYTIMTGVIVALALLMPGVSGSYILNVLGSYCTVLSAIMAVVSGIFCFSFPVEAWGLLLNLGIGVLVGLLFLSKIVLRFFEKYPCSTQAFVSGMMFGSIFCLWPFQKVAFVIDPLRVKQGLLLVGLERYVPSLHECATSWPLLLATMCAFCAVFFLRRFSKQEPIAVRE